MFGFQFKEEDNHKQKQRIQEITTKQKISKYEPTWEEIWITGYPTNNGKRKTGILRAKNTVKDNGRLLEVKKAIEEGDLGTEVESLRKFTKAHALRLHALLSEKQKEGYLDYLVQNCPDNYELITTKEHLLDFEKDLKEEEFLVVDTETTGLRIWHGDKVVGLCLGLEKADRFAYVPFGHNTSETQLQEELVWGTFREYLENPDYKKILHNFKYDAHILFNAHNIDLKGLYWDTLSAQTFLCEEEPSYALKNLLTKYKNEIGFKEDSKTYEELFGKCGFENTSLPLARYYGSHDCKGTLALFRWQESFFKKMPKLYKLLMELEMPQLEVSLQMERNGMLIDLEYAAEYTVKLSEEVHKLEDELKETFGEINWNSPKQIQNLLYNVLKLEDTSRKQSTDAKTLKKLVKQAPALQMVLDYREKAKLLSTYYEPLPKLIAGDGRIHGQFNPHKTVTSRYNSEKPNLQNIAPDARPMFVPEKGKVIIGIDYSQIEPKFTAYASKCPNMQKPYIEGWDFYSSLAASIFKKPIEECGDGTIERKRAKQTLLSAAYGIHVNSLAETMGISIEEAEKVMNDFYSSNPEMAQYKQETFDEIDRQGFTTTELGRKRRFIGHIQLAKQLLFLKQKYEKKLGRELGKNIWEETGLNYKEKRAYWDVQKVVERNYRMAFNFRIQGACAEIMKKAMLGLYHYCKRNPEFKLIASIHDEVLIEAPLDITKEQVNELEHIMVSARQIPPIKLTVDTEFFLKWGYGTTKEEWFQQRRA